LHKTILDECWRPAFARYLYLRFEGLRREPRSYLYYYNHDRAHNGRLTRGRIPANVVYGARKMETKWAAPVGTSRNRSRPPDLRSMRVQPDLDSGYINLHTATDSYN